MVTTVARNRLPVNLPRHPLPAPAVPPRALAALFARPAATLVAVLLAVLAWLLFIGLFLALRAAFAAPVIPHAAATATDASAPIADPAPIADLTADQLARRAKCRRLWRAFAPWSYSDDLADYFVAEHERLGIGDQWYWSLVYGFSTFGLTTGKCVQGCYGPMDQKWPFARGCRAACRALAAGRPWSPRLLRDPYINIRCHVLEMAYYHRRTGRAGLPLLATVFYPARPMEYRRWRPTEAKFRAALARRP